MRIHKSLSILLTAVVGFIILSPAAVVEAAPTATSKVAADFVSGRVVNAAGEALVGAQVSVIVAGSTETVITARTQADGSYKLSVPNIPGAYTLRVLHVGYSPVTMAMTREVTGWNIPEQISMRPIAGELAIVPAV